MKIEVSFSDVYLDEEDNLQDAFKKQIIFEVFQKIKETIQKKVDDQITLEVKRLVENSMYAEITKAVKEIIDKGEVKSRYNNEKVSMETYVHQVFSERNNWPNVEDYIKKIGENFAKEMRNRYDLLFASQIVAKMNDNGLLKEGYAKLLTEEKQQ